MRLGSCTSALWNRQWDELHVFDSNRIQLQMGVIMARKKKSWIEKLDNAKAKEDLPKTFYCDKAKQHMLVPSPAQIEQEMRRIRRTKVSSRI